MGGNKKSIISSILEKCEGKVEWLSEHFSGVIIYRGKIKKMKKFQKSCRFFTSGFVIYSRGGNLET